tara:strand:+ start:2294 stop:3313 length:1020 start_codon:yes stop_codon:yes gene_type:complete
MMNIPKKIYVLCGFILFCVACSMAQKRIQKSDHFDGHVYFNPFPDYKKKGFSDFISWRMNSVSPVWEEREIKPITHLPSQSIEGSVTFINHATTAIQLDGTVVLTDPIWAERASPVSFAGPKRYHAPALSLKQLGWVDIVVISHSHYDHLCLETLIELEKLYSPLFIAPLGLEDLLSSHDLVHIKTLDWWESINHKNLNITLAPAQHWSKRTLFNDNHTLWGSYYIQSKKHRVYFGGDTGYGPHFKQIYERLGPADLALLPIGAYKPEWFMKDNHMGPKDVPLVKKELHANYVMAIHFGTFPLGDDGQDEPEEVLLEEAKTQEDPSHYIVPKVGQSLIL